MWSNVNVHKKTNFKCTDVMNNTIIEDFSLKNQNIGDIHQEHFECRKSENSKIQNFRNSWGWKCEIPLVEIEEIEDFEGEILNYCVIHNVGAFEIGFVKHH